MADNKKEKHPGGRPVLELDADQIKVLARAFCTNEEIAATMGCSSDTLTRRYAGVIKEGRDAAKLSLRSKQYHVAMSGNVSMLIWLGKQYLGQSDKVASEITGAGGGAIEIDLTEALNRAYGMPKEPDEPTG